MFAVALGFIGLLVYISQTRSGDAATATSLAPVEQSAPAAGGGPATDVAPVAGSDPVAEWQETEHKLAAMATALQFA